jgi:hypothetical protein
VISALDRQQLAQRCGFSYCTALLQGQDGVAGMPREKGSPRSTIGDKATCASGGPLVRRSRPRRWWFASACTLRRRTAAANRVDLAHVSNEA